MLTTEKRSKSRNVPNAVSKRDELIRKHIGTYVPPVPPPLPHNYPDSVYSVRNPSLHTARSGSETQSAERLNLYLDRQEGEDEHEEEAVDETVKKKSRWKRNFRIALPHVGLVILSTAYTLLGAAIFHHYEKPFEEHLRNETAHRVHSLKQRIIDNLWEMNNNGTPYTIWAEHAQIAMDDIIRDVFIDYTRNYMTPEDVITGTGPYKWSFGSSIFFSWTAITTIGYGHIVPRTNAGRIAIIFYALFGIPLILVTIADMGRFLSGGIIWVHNTYRNFMDSCYAQCWKCIKCLCCRMRKKQKQIQMPTIELLQKQRHMYGTVRRSRKTHDNHSDAGTFEDISEIHTQNSEAGAPSEDTRAQAEDIEQELPHHERRVSVMFILVIMLGYVAGGACLIRYWESWSFFDAFYFCFVTVTTIGFGDIVPLNVDFFPATLAYIILGLIITTMCIDLVGSEYIRDIHFYGRSLGRSFMTIGGKVVHLGEVFGYVAFLQKNYGLTPEQLNKLAQLPEEYLLDCLINGRQPDLNWIGGRPYVPPDIYYFKWIEHPRTLSFASDRVLASMESLDLNTSRCSTARTLTPREYYQKILFQYCKQIQPDDQMADIDQ